MRRITFVTTALLLLTGCSGANFPGIGALPDGTPSSLTTIDASAVPTELVAGILAPATNAQPTSLPAITGCQAPATVTVALTEGPYWKAGSPERSSLIEAGVTGTKITITGTILDTNCQPVAGALLDFWQADAQGNYDNQGYVLRGHQYTGEDGRYQLETIVPGLYPGRTEHIHVKVQAPGGPVITTQIFFPGQPANQTDSIFDPSLVLPVQTVNGGLAAEYNFIVPSN